MKTDKTTHALIAEDDYLVSEMIRGILQELGIIVAGTATTGLQAVELTASLQPHIVIMDIQMPELGGISAARQIQECCPTPVIILTAHETPETVAEASQSGVNAYLLKPPNSREMERAITIALARFEDMMALRQANEELNAFAHTVAHDLQSPLGLISGFSEMLQHNYAQYTEEKRQEILAAITRTAHKMSNIVDELLLLSGVRLMAVEPIPMDMAQAVNGARQRLTHEIDQAQATITVPTAWPVALGHTPWVEEVWVNYLSNGLKYGGRPSFLALGADIQDDGTVRFWVRDNGPGLTPAEQEDLFLPFTKLSQARTKGHGLGLSIVRRIVERLDGAVGVASEAGAGCTFWFSLPGVDDAII